MADWNARQYLKFERERTQPSADLIARAASSLGGPPRSVLDIGCGPGNSTAALRRAFPEAELLGVDRSPDMLARARSLHPDLRFASCTVPQGLAELGRFDLLFSNACLHWIPRHETLLPALAGSLNPGGLLAVQMPLTQRSPFYAALGDLLREPRWQSLQAVRLFHNRPPEETYDILVSSFASVEMWETVYEHVLPGPESVLEWYRGSGLRPYLDRLPEAERSPFEAALLERIRGLFSPRADGSILLPMPRHFFLAWKEEK